MNTINKIILLLTILIMQPITADKITAVKIELPSEVEWNQITDQSEELQYLREWIPSDKTIENTNWLIVQQKLKLKKKKSAKKFLKKMFSLAKKSCTNVKYNGPKKIETEKAGSYWGRFMCAQENGKEYGTFTDIRTIADGKIMHVVISELRIPPSSVAGVMNFGKDINAIKQFMSLQSVSSLFTRENVEVQ